MSLPMPQPKPDVAQRYRHRNQEKQMIKARKERVRELIRSLESVKVRSRAPGEEESTFEGRSSSFAETGAGKNDAAHSPREAGNDIQSAIDHMRVAVADDSHLGT